MVLQKLLVLGQRRQILLSFIVKSVQHNAEPESESLANKKPDASENSSDAVANDSAFIKIMYGNEGNAEVATPLTGQEQSKPVDVYKNKNGDGEGFVVVTKQRRNKQQITNGLYNQQSICASVR
ncbi:hypothetical protein Tsubulata_009261 [Turnera subulata]|uniref:Uncharacterized protein n=1 Tax=Turnera subulata TaxID=218843 RepID=A0A9Q0JGN8_9ROSI|nr:hypothetical protein Tsubulata_009261 [Turnera subulata]